METLSNKLGKVYIEKNYYYGANSTIIKLNGSNKDELRSKALSSRKVGQNIKAKERIFNFKGAIRAWLSTNT